MNKFAKNSSRIFYAIIWLFTAALFADGANLDDLLPGIVVLHSDEDFTSQTDAQLLASSAVKTPVRSHALPPSPQKKTASRPAPPLKIIYDQDSDSLAASPASLAESFIVLPPETPVEHHSATLVQSLYLVNCTLLI